MSMAGPCMHRFYCRLCDSLTDYLPRVCRQPLLIRPVEVRDLLGGVGTGPGGMSRAEWQQRRQEEQQRSQRRAQQDEEQAQQLIEASAYGILRAASSDNLHWA